LPLAALCSLLAETLCRKPLVTLNWLLPVMLDELLPVTLVSLGTGDGEGLLLVALD
jgi:hypothetical protein